MIAPDMLGYGGTSKPLDAEDYSTKKLCADLAALLDLLDIKRAVSLLQHRPNSAYFSNFSFVRVVDIYWARLGLIHSREVFSLVS